MATILIADDRQVDRHYLATLLSYYGHRIVEAGDGGRALEAALTERPDLIVSDVLMPTIDGYELVRRLREIPEIAQTPVIFYTAMYHEHEAAALARQYGVIDVMIKPSEPEAIVAKVDAVLGRTPTEPRRPPVTRAAPDNLQAVTDELAEKVRALEATEQRLAAVVNLGHRFTGQTDP